MIDDIIASKAANIERCIKRINEIYQGHENEFMTNFTIQDAIILNLQRAIEACIDMGMRIIRIKKLGLPQSSKEIFLILEEANIINSMLSKKLCAMTAFRNIAIHEYTHLKPEIVQSIIEKNLSDLTAFSSAAIALK